MNRPNGGPLVAHRPRVPEHAAATAGPAHGHATKTTAWAVGRAIGKAVGRAIGKAVGRAIGKAIDEAIGKAIDEAIGKAIDENGAATGVSGSVR